MFISTIRTAIELLVVAILFDLVAAGQIGPRRLSSVFYVAAGVFAVLAFAGDVWARYKRDSRDLVTREKS